jgi:hypothetical protein
VAHRHSGIVANDALFVIRNVLSDESYELSDKITSV